MGWAYHYSQTLFGSGSHYLLFDEDDDGEGADPYASTPPCLLPLLPPPLPPPSPPPAPDLRTLLKSGTLCANGESAAWCERLKRTLLTGAPLAMLSNTGGVTQAFASLHKAMIDAKTSTRTGRKRK